jgi:hypothetical protein
MPGEADLLLRNARLQGRGDALADIVISDGSRDADIEGETERSALRSQRLLLHRVIDGE